MKPAPFDYVKPETLEEALEHLAQAGPEAAILAGGQTLLPLLALRMSTPSLVVDINGIAELQGFSHGTDGLKVGAVTRQAAALGDATVAEHLPILAHAISHVGHVQTRARGTIGGSVSLGEPAAELPATAVALGASVEVRSASERRMIPAEELYYGPYTTALEPEELVTAVHFPTLKPGTQPFFREIARRPGDFALVGLVGTICVTNGKVADASIAWFGMGPMPMKSYRAEAALIGQAPEGLDFAGIAELAVADTDPFDDHHATADYRRTVAKRALARALTETLNVRQAA
ncbi:FAD binding domain-containing protein [Stakelama tenebrarum]|uniref:Xanthine dehydrogenase family protein subunit M n=1 Tax=Stakelama tenebrarum TaxID=2711215 RepID=A0A6G6Y480_9SPHN|nr:xanthine dehydrogenase family protein subunit M [Sphingosinithalassobacter tenebrarum]QIG79651.1 xanthine dehydrogenase family protein subunit M [Sphingosinithalassobacter tenebrarum]